MLLEKVKALCKERGTNVYQLEQALGMSKGAISKWSTTIPSVLRVKAVADYFGITLDELLTAPAENLEVGA